MQGPPPALFPVWDAVCAVPTHITSFRLNQIACAAHAVYAVRPPLRTMKVKIEKNIRGYRGKPSIKSREEDTANSLLVKKDEKGKPKLTKRAEQAGWRFAKKEY